MIAQGSSRTYVPKQINLIPAGVAVVGLLVEGLLFSNAPLGGGIAAAEEICVTCRTAIDYGIRYPRVSCRSSAAQRSQQ